MTAHDAPGRTISTNQEDHMNNPEALHFLAETLGVNLLGTDPAEEFELLLASFPQDWEPLSEEQINDCRRALA